MMQQWPEVTPEAVLMRGLALKLLGMPNGFKGGMPYCMNFGPAIGTSAAGPAQDYFLYTGIKPKSVIKSQSALAVQVIVFMHSTLNQQIENQQFQKIGCVIA